ncbi:colanic acid biosynthesis glycosyltransferase WcaL [Phyllobacterium salinisoli]|uniref:Colanic acid biosynthesis glycosyltransferase WcaL n=1 Tax=Phyllobacterium salinisoli TaxID=1899321 RepID=A0A368K409_9HYPH|nr:glycosyltransferase family 4 protein [Phyllobacterium salinisoli]RCS22750.1 colanic acid biosynthesis glycosyltransferase WcaL [Phyllobacterium salinisoli]
MHSRKIVVVVKGYPRLSETFIAQELLGLERAGIELVIVALRRPTDGKRHPVHDEIKACVHYLPEYLHEEPLRLVRSALTCFPRAGFRRALGAFVRDLRRDPTRNRIRRFGQALVLAAEWPERAGWLHAHFAHTPASVTRYTSLLRGLPWTCSAHAKDIWTSEDWDLADKLSSARWMVTCTKAGFTHLKSLASGSSRVHLSYHGLDLARFGRFEGDRPPHDGSSRVEPVDILSVGRAVEKKGYDTLLQALALLPRDLAWRFVHAGGGDQLDRLKALAEKLGIAPRISWKGALAQEDVLRLYRDADIFALACRIAADGDRDGLPNVLVEAASQRLICVSTNVSGVPELLTDGETGLLVPPDDPAALARALERTIRHPALRTRLGDAAERHVRTRFDHRSSIGQLKSLFEQEWQATI